MKARIVNLSKTNLILTILLVLFCVISLYPLLMNLLDKSIVKRFDKEARLNNNIIINNIIEKQSDSIRRLVKPIYLSQEVNQYLNNYNEQEQLKNILMGISGHLHSKYALDQILSFNENKEKVYSSIIGETSHILEMSTVNKYVSNIISSQKTSGEIIINNKGKPLWVVSIISQDVRNAKQFYHLFVFELDHLIKNYKRRVKGIYNIKIGNQTIFSKTKNETLTKIGRNKYIDANKKRFSFREINLGTLNFKKTTSVNLLVETDKLVQKFKRTKDYEIIILILFTLFLIPSLFVFFLYHRAFFKLLKDAILKLESNTNINFTKDEYGTLCSNLNKLKKSISNKNILIETLMDSGLIKFFYFDRLGEIGNIKSQQCSQMILSLEKNKNIFNFFEEYGQVEQKHTRNLVDLVWDSDNLVDFKTLSEGFPTYIHNLEKIKINLTYFPMYNDEHKLDGVLVACSSKPD